MKLPPHQMRNMLLHPLKVSKVKEISGNAKKLHQSWLLISMPQNMALLADGTATTSGEEHVTSPQKCLKSKKYLER